MPISLLLCDLDCMPNRDFNAINYAGLFYKENQRKLLVIITYRVLQIVIPSLSLVDCATLLSSRAVIILNEIGPWISLSLLLLPEDAPFPPGQTLLLSLRGLYPRWKLQRLLSPT